MSGFTHEPSGGGQPDWYTPPEIFAALNLEFDLDPCAPPLPAAGWLPVKQRISLPVDGLTATWRGRVWLNPPYASETARWVGKLASHGDGIALTFVRSDTPWWQHAARAASLICLLKGRIRFIDGLSNRPGGSPGAPSCLLAYGSECAQALERAGLGVCFTSGSGDLGQLEFAA